MNPFDDGYKETHYQFKVLVTGEPCVGKTSLVARYTTGQFSTGYKSTIGVDFATKEIQWDADTVVTLQLWDLAGQDRLNAQARAYYRDTDGAICVCDVSRIRTKADAFLWKEGIKERAVAKDGTVIDPPCALIVNKMDLYGKACDDKAAFFPQSAGISMGPENGVEIPLHDDIMNHTEPTPQSIQQWCKDVELQTYDMAREAGFITGVPVCVSQNIGMDSVFKSLISEMIRRRQIDRAADDVENFNQAGIINLKSPTEHQTFASVDGSCYRC